MDVLQKRITEQIYKNDTNKSKAIKSNNFWYCNHRRSITHGSNRAMYNNAIAILLKLIAT